MKKKLTFISLILLVCFVALTGCGLIQRDQNKYLNQVVASCGEVEVTMEELLIEYNGNYSTLANSYNYTDEQIVDYSLDKILNRKILILKSEELYGDLTNEEVYDCLIETYDYLKESIESYADDIRKELGTYVEDSTEKESEDEVTYASYKPMVEFKDGVIVKVDKEDNTVRYLNYLTDYVAGFKSYYLNGATQESATVREAYRRFVRDLRKNQEYQNNKDNSDDSVLLREIDRVMKIQKANQKVTRLQENYVDEHITSITNEDILAEYIRLQNKNKAEYDIVGGKEAFVTDIIKSVKDVYYIPDGEEGNFFYVSHILINFSEEQKELISEQEAIKNQDSSYTQDDLDAFTSELAKEIKVEKKDDNGNVVTDLNGNTVYLTANELLELVRADLMAADNSIEARAAVLNKYFYLYGTDPGVQNNTFDYVIGTKDESAQTDTRKPDFVDEFVEAARLLHSAYIGATYTDENGYLDDGAYIGELGSITGLVQSSYGYHIIVYLGPINNMIVNTNDATKACEDLSNYKVNAHSNQTYFHYIFDSIYDSETNYTIYQQSIITQYKSSNQIEKYASTYNDLIKK